MITDRITGEELERNILRFKSWTLQQRINWMEKLDKLIPKKDLKEIKDEITAISYDKNTLKKIGLSYSNPDVQLIKCALIDYLYKDLY